MSFKNLFSFALLIIVALSTSACLQVNTGKNKKTLLPDGGMFASTNYGDNWNHRTSIMSVGGEDHNFSMDEVSVLTSDPSEPATLYFGTIDQGMLYSYDRGVSWQLAIDLGPGTINSIAVDPGNKCNVYVAKANELYKTEDCNRSWEEVFTDSIANTLVSNVAVDHFATKNIYLTLSRGDIVKSENGGESWKTIHRFEESVNKFYIDPNDSRLMYADIEDDGLHKSIDGGNTWQDINAIFEDFEIGGDVVDVELFKNNPELIFVATSLGIIKSDDGAKTWTKLSLLPPKDDALITSVAVDPKNTNNIYYITGTTFYKSIDGGKNWSPRLLPSTRKSKILMIDDEKSEIIYLGVGGLR